MTVFSPTRLATSNKSSRLINQIPDINRSKKVWWKNLEVKKIQTLTLVVVAMMITTSNLILKQTLKGRYQAIMNIMRLVMISKDHLHLPNSTEMNQISNTNCTTAILVLLVQLDFRTAIKTTSSKARKAPKIILILLKIFMDQQANPQLGSKKQLHQEDYTKKICSNTKKAKISKEEEEAIMKITTE